MVELRAAKVASVANDIPALEVNGPARDSLLVLGWGGTLGSITAAVEEARLKGIAVSQAHLRHLNPFPSNLGEVLDRFENVLLPELSAGDLALLLRARFLKDIKPLNKIAGQPFKVREILEAIESIVTEEA